MTLPLANIRQRETGVVAGNVPTRLFGAESTSGNSPNRTAVQVCNLDPVRSLLVRVLVAGAELVSITANDYDYSVPPRATLMLEVGSSLDVAIQNDGFSATTSAYSAMEVS